MMKYTGQLRILTWTFLLVLLCSTMSFAFPDAKNIARLKAAKKIRVENPDSAIQLLTLCYPDFMDDQDTINAINTLSFLATVYGHQANYSASYDNLWKALLLADEARSDSIKVYLYQRIGRYYAFYKRRVKALHFLKLATELNKLLVAKGIMNSASLSQRYMAYSASYREFGELQSAQIYLDSCFLYYEEGDRSGIKLSALKMAQAFIYTKAGRSNEAIQLLEALFPRLKETNPQTLVLVYSHLGDAYLAKGLVSKSAWFYEEALNVSGTYHSHIDFSVLIHEKLARLYFNQKQYVKAYQQLDKVLQLDRLFFDSRSEYNRPLLEIQDEFRNAMEAKEQLLKEKRIAQLEHENKVRILRNITILVLLGFLVLFGILFFYYLRNKHQVEKHLINLDIKASKELLELKNKELASSALKLIEKDKFLEEIKERIAKNKEKINHQEIKHLIKTATIGNEDTWTAFEAQFVTVNNGFFEKLKEACPKLTQGELRLCALIRLKLNSREVAGLMRISTESVHKSRYRLRKKLNLEKGSDLTDYMSSLT